MAGRGRHGADLHFIRAMAQGKSVKAAAAEAGLSERTAFRRLEDPEINHQIDEKRARLNEVVVDRLLTGADSACQKMNELMGARSENVQLSAARAIVDRMIRVKDRHDLEVRLREMQQLLDQAASAGSQQNSYWPDVYDSRMPNFQGLHRQDALRHTANWINVRMFDPGRTPEELQAMKQRMEKLRDTAMRIDKAYGNLDPYFGKSISPVPDGAELLGSLPGAAEPQN
jgi:hypothetical protein